MPNSETIRLEMGNLARRLASPASPGESVKACIRRAALRCGLDYSTLKRLWYSEIKVVPAHIADQLRAAATKHDENLRANMLRALEAMRQSDPQFFSADIEAACQLLLLDRDKTGEGSIQD